MKKAILVIAVLAAFGSAHAFAQEGCTKELMILAQACANYEGTQSANGTKCSFPNGSSIEYILNKDCTLSEYRMSDEKTQKIYVFGYIPGAILTE